MCAWCGVCLRWRAGDTVRSPPVPGTWPSVVCYQGPWPTNFESWMWHCHCCRADTTSSWCVPLRGRGCELSMCSRAAARRVHAWMCLAAEPGSMCSGGSVASGCSASNGAGSATTDRRDVCARASNLEPPCRRARCVRLPSPHHQYVAQQRGSDTHQSHVQRCTRACACVTA